MHNILNLILESKKKKIELLRKNRSGVESLMKKVPAPLSFKNAIKQPGKISLIGEIKQASPSAGVIKKDFSPAAIAKVYEGNGIKAISVLTEEEFFLGKINDITAVKEAVGIPVMRKDFILDEVQILEARAAGADAVLLIMRILSEEQLAKLYAFSKSLGMDALVEVHTQNELKKVVNCGVDMVGVNNRNLNTLTVDAKRTQQLMPFIPQGVVRVSESGIKSRKDMLLLKGLDVDAVLVGETLMRSSNPAETISELNIDR